MGEIPDEALEIIGENWSTLGFNPVFLYRLCERGYLHCEIDFVMKQLIGDDWASVNATTWIERLEAQGHPTIIHSCLYDTPPVIDILDEEIALHLSLDYPKELCPMCKHIKLEERQSALSQ